MPIQTVVRPPSTPRILRLGDDYKRRKEKLKEELREDYRNAMAEVQKVILLEVFICHGRLFTRCHVFLEKCENWPKTKKHR